MTRSRLHSLLLAGGVCATLLTCAISSQAQQYDPYDGAATPQAYDASDQIPGRVARLAYMDGQVQFAPAGGDSWGNVEINRPMVIGDRLLTGEDGRAALELGDSSVRIDHSSAFDFLNLAPDNVQMELSQGTLNLAVRQIGNGENFEVDTPTIAFVATAPGMYRVDNDPDGTGSIVTVFEGSGVVYGENGVNRQVEAGRSYRFNDSALLGVDVNGIPEPDDFDRFCETRDNRFDDYAQQPQQYIPPGMIGGEDLHQYGQWAPTPDYGNVWYPTSVPAGWAPYRYGHWAWIQPWGWTWVDNQPWGFAPFHYGRWVHVRNRWGWMPGPVDVRPVYAPALVAFIGGSGLSLSIRIGGGQPVGWFPLGPRDVYTPWFHASRGYFNRVNVTNIRPTYVNVTIINNFYDDYRAGRPWRGHGRHHYPYRDLPGAVTVVNRNVFVDARPVHPAVLKLDRNRLERLDVALRPGVNPGKSSLGLRRPTAQPAVLRQGEPFTRPVVVRHEPPPRPVSFETRKKVIATQHGQPLTPVQIRNLQQHQSDDAHRASRVKLARAEHPGDVAHRVTSGHREANAGRAPIRPGASAQQPDAQMARRGTRPQEPFKNTVHPIQAPIDPAGKTSRRDELVVRRGLDSGNTADPIRAPINRNRETPRRPHELASARFAHPDRPAAKLPQVPVIRPADGEPERATASRDNLSAAAQADERRSRARENRAEPMPRPMIRAPSRDTLASLQPRHADEHQVQVQQQRRAQQVERQQPPQQRERAQQAQEREAQQAELRARQQQAQAQQREHAQQARQQQARQQQAQQQQAQQAELRGRQQQAQAQQREHAQQQAQQQQAQQAELRARQQQAQRQQFERAQQQQAMRARDNQSQQARMQPRQPQRAPQQAADNEQRTSPPHPDRKRDDRDEHHR